jgi:hypothetical protein
VREKIHRTTVSGTNDKVTTTHPIDQSSHVFLYADFSKKMFISHTCMMILPCNQLYIFKFFFFFQFFFE